jgi:hypothetical protein
MKKSILLVVFYLVANVCFADEGLNNLWKKFYIEAKKQNYDEPVKIYQVDTSNKTLCFIYKSYVYFFKEGKIEKPTYAKMFNVNGINRISYKESKHGGTFLLWSNEELVISFGL